MEEAYRFQLAGYKGEQEYLAVHRISSEGVSVLYIVLQIFYVRRFLVYESSRPLKISMQYIFRRLIESTVSGVFTCLLFFFFTD